MPLEKIVSKIKNFLLKFFLIDDTPHKVAAGAALGVFWGIMPGEGIGTTIVTAAIFRFNRLSAVTAALATNTWTSFFILPLAAVIGGYIFKTDPGKLIDDFKNTYHLDIRYFFTEDILFGLIIPLLAGFAIVSIAISMLVYFSVYFLLKYRKIRFR
ncbi:MAG: DUF2062 domain-containing protein [Candidatus Moranbacteria bacterium]|nr:DUF2062 domain-containing protein [Candidatus Moranbacteria bacterium]